MAARRAAGVARIQAQQLGLAHSRMQADFPSVGSRLRGARAVDTAAMLGQQVSKGRMRATDRAPDVDELLAVEEPEHPRLLRRELDHRLGEWIARQAKEPLHGENPVSRQQGRQSKQRA